MTEQQTTEEETVETEGGTENETPNAEAARYRLRAKEAETERDTLRGQVEAMRKAEVERLAGADVQQPGALWAAGIELADLLADDGSVDPTKVKTAVTDAAERLGLARKVTGAVSPREGRNGRPAPSGQTFESAFKL